MSWFHRIIGGGLGFLFGGPIGSMIGLAIGHMMDKANEAEGRSGFFQRIGLNQNSAESIQVAFFTAIFSLLAKVAKADGRISEEEGQHFLNILNEMRLHGELRQFAINAFNEAKNSPYSHSDFALQLKQIAARVPMYGQSSSALLQQFFYTLVSMAAVDGHISSSEDKVLREIAAAFGFSETLIRQAYSQFQMAGRSGQTVQIDTAYEVLGLSPQASDEEVRSAYRKLVKETHPDKLVQQGLPPEMKTSAEKRFHEIQEAWEQIRKQRGMT